MTIFRKAENSLSKKRIGKKNYSHHHKEQYFELFSPVFLSFPPTSPRCIDFPGPARGAGVSCQICGVISQLSKAGKSIVYGGVKGYFQAAGFKMGTRMCSVSLNSAGGFQGGLPPLWHMQHGHNELYYNYKAQSVEVDNIDIWPGGGVCCSTETGPLQTAFLFRSL